MKYEYLGSRQLVAHEIMNNHKLLLDVASHTLRTTLSGNDHNMGYWTQELPRYNDNVGYWTQELPRYNDNVGYWLTTSQ